MTADNSDAVAASAGTDVGDTLGYADISKEINRSGTDAQDIAASVCNGKGTGTIT